MDSNKVMTMHEAIAKFVHDGDSAYLAGFTHLIPFAAGMVLTTAMQLPAFDPSLVLLNFSLFFLLLPIPTRSATYGSLHFGTETPRPRILRGWIAATLVIVLAILIAEKIGIPIP